jgi:hypothetical protein
VGKAAKHYISKKVTRGSWDFKFAAGRGTSREHEWLKLHAARSVARPPQQRLTNLGPHGSLTATATPAAEPGTSDKPPPTGAPQDPAAGNFPGKLLMQQSGPKPACPMTDGSKLRRHGNVHATTDG